MSSINRNNDVNMNQNQIINAVLENVENNPEDAKRGQICYNITNSTVKIYNGSAWVDVGGGGSGNVSIYDITPSPADGTDGDIAIYYKGIYQKVGGVWNLVFTFWVDETGIPFVDNNQIVIYDDYGNIVINKGTKLLATENDGEQHELIGLAEYPSGVRQIEVGSIQESLNLNTDNRIGVDTQNGHKIVAYTDDVSVSNVSVLQNVSVVWTIGESVDPYGEYNNIGTISNSDIKDGMLAFIVIEDIWKGGIWPNCKVSEGMITIYSNRKVSDLPSSIRAIQLTVM